MASKLAEINDEKCEMEMTSMIDVTFLLLIFFMCTLKFKTLEGKLAAYLPKDVGVNQSEAEEIEKVEILVRVKKDRSTGAKMTGVKLRPGSPPVRYTPDDAKEGRRYQWNTPELAAKPGNSSLNALPMRRIEYSVGPFKTEDLKELEDKLRKTHKDKQPTMPIDEKTGEPKLVPATIDARTGTCYEDIADVLDAALNANFEEITFVGDHGENVD